jgi:Cu/Ag efflux pump CusA
VRLRPILMTTCAMIAGAVPGAISQGIGHELRQPMNIAVIGGLVVSTMLTLIVVPCFYSILDQVLVRLRPNPSPVGKDLAAHPQEPVASHEAFGK